MSAVGYIDKAIQIAVHEVLGVIFKVRAKSIEDGPEFVLKSPLIYSVGFVGQVEGTLLISFSKEHACQIVSKMLGTKVEEFNEETVDGVCEFLNMIAGNVQVRMAEVGYSFDISIPMVYQGREIELIKQKNLHVLRNTFNCDEFSFDLILLFKIYEGGQVPDKKVLEKAHMDAEKILKELIERNT